MKPRSLIILFCLVAASATTHLHALEFRLLSWDGDIRDLKYGGGPKAVDVVATEGALSPKYTYNGSGPLVLFREVKQEDKTVRVPVASLTPPEGVTQAILVLAATDAAGTGYTARWINDSPEVRREQTITYENLSSHPVAIKLGKDELYIAPGAATTRATNPDVFRLALKVAAQTPKGWEMVISSSQPVRPRLRTLVILRDGRENPYGPKEPVEYLAFNDLLPQKETPGS